MDVFFVYPWISEYLIESASECKKLSQFSAEISFYLIDRMFKAYLERLLFEVFISNESCDISEDIIVDRYITGRSPCRSHAVICSVVKFDIITESDENVFDF